MKKQDKQQRQNNEGRLIQSPYIGGRWLNLKSFYDTYNLCASSMGLYKYQYDLVYTNGMDIHTAYTLKKGVFQTPTGQRIYELLTQLQERHHLSDDILYQTVELAGNEMITALKQNTFATNPHVINYFTKVLEKVIRLRMVEAQQIVNDEQAIDKLGARLMDESEFGQSKHGQSDGRGHVPKKNSDRLMRAVQQKAREMREKWMENYYGDPESIEK